MEKTSGGKREEQIVEQALRLFSQSGFHGTSLQEIADELGVTRPAFYYYFKSKDDLLWRLIGNLGDGLLAEAQPIVAGRGNERDKLRRLVVAHTRAVLNNVDAFRVYFAERQLVNRHRDRRLKKGEDEYLELWTRLIEQGQKSGAFKQGDPKVLALLVSGLATSPLRWFRPHGELSIDQTAELIAGMATAAIQRSA